MGKRQIHLISRKITRPMTHLHRSKDPEDSHCPCNLQKDWMRRYAESDTLRSCILRRENDRIGTFAARETLPDTRFLKLQEYIAVVYMSTTNTLGWLHGKNTSLREVELNYYQLRSPRPSVSISRIWVHLGRYTNPRGQGKQGWDDDEQVKNLPWLLKKWPPPKNKHAAKKRTGH